MHSNIAFPTLPVRRAAVYLLLTISALLFFAPMFIVFTTAFKSPSELRVAEFTLLPVEWAVSNFPKAFSTGMWGRYFFNSFLVTSLAVVGSLFLNSLAGYSFARLRFRFKDVIFMLFLIGIMVPPQSIIIPQFIIMRSIPLAGGNGLLGTGGTGWLDTYWALLIPRLSGSFGIFMCRQFYLGFPNALDDAARIDGVGPFQTYLRIYVPMSGPILAALAILKAVHTWNDFFFPLIMTSSDEMQTVQLALANFRGEFATEWELLLAATTVSLLPLVALFLGAQKHFVRGIVTQGLKG